MIVTIFLERNILIIDIQERIDMYIYLVEIEVLKLWEFKRERKLEERIYIRYNFSIKMNSVIKFFLNEFLILNFSSRYFYDLV